MELKKYLSDKSGRIPRGAVARLTEYLGTHRLAAMQILAGVSRNAALLQRAAQFVATRQPFAGHRPGIKSRVKEAAVLSRYDAGESLERIGARHGITGERVRQIAAANGRKMRREKKKFPSQPVGGINDLRTTQKKSVK